MSANIIIYYYNVAKNAKHIDATLLPRHFIAAFHCFPFINFIFDDASFYTIFAPTLRLIEPYFTMDL